MRFVYVLEDDLKFQKDIVEAIYSIDPKIQIRVFPKLAEFIDWVRLMMEEGPSAISKGGQFPASVQQEPVIEEAHQLVTIISKIEFLGKKQLPLMQKTRSLFIERGICTKEDPTAFVLAAFDKPDFQIHDLQDPILANVIFKPFDRLILIQHLTFAVDGRHPPSKYTIANQKMSAVIEMIKEVDLEEVSEVGFLTRSSGPLDKGQFAKYYGSAFLTERRTSVMARLVDCRPHPKNPSEFQCAFVYFGADPVQITGLRKKIKAVHRKSLSPFHWKEVCPGLAMQRTVNIVVIDEDEDLVVKPVIDSIKRHFKNVNCVGYNNISDFFMDLDPKMVDSAGAPPPKAFSLSDFELILDDKLTTILNFTSPSKEPFMLFGHPFADLKEKKNWMIEHIDSSCLEAWKQWALKPTPDAIFVVRSGADRFYIKPSSFQKKEKELAIKFTELSSAEKMAYLAKNSQLPVEVDFVFIGHRYLGDNAKERWTGVKEKLEKRASGKCQPQFFLFAGKEYTDLEARDLSDVFTDIFLKPLDRSYMLQKLKLQLMNLPATGDPIEMPMMFLKEVIRAANPAPVTEISEAGLIMQYHRTLDIGSFREFLLWQAYEHGSPIMKAQCNFVEEASTKGLFNIHFVFFGINDHFLKTIRLWIRDNYILSKEKG